MVYLNQLFPGNLISNLIYLINNFSKKENILFSHRLSSKHNRYYQIIRASLNDTGSYTCLAENKIGIAKKDIHIDVLCKAFKIYFCLLNKKLILFSFLSTTIYC